MKKLPTIRIQPQIKANTPRPRLNRQIMALATPWLINTTLGTAQMKNSGGSMFTPATIPPIRAGRMMDDTIQSQPHVGLSPDNGEFASGLADSEILDMVLAVKNECVSNEEYESHHRQRRQQNKPSPNAKSLFES